MNPRFILVLGSLLLLVAIAPAAEAQEELALEVRAGFDAFYKVGVWTPVQVTVANRGAGLKARLQVRDESAGFSAANVLYVYPVELPAQSRQQFTLYLPLRGQRQLSVDLVDAEGRLLLSRRRSVEGLDSRAFLVGVVAGDPSLLNALAGLNTAGGNRVAVAHLDLEDLPPLPQAWAGLDMLVVNDVDTSRLTPAQQEALANWVSFGGRLVVGGGPGAAQTIAGLKSLLYFTDVTVVNLPHPLTSLEGYVGQPLEDRGPYVAAVPNGARGWAVVRQGEWPLISARPYNSGQVYYLALDLGLAPLDALAGHPRFLPRLLGLLEPQTGRLADSANWRDMRNSLTLIPDQTLPTPGALALYLVVYILALSPLNYLMLRYFKRREWAWFSIPAIILLFSGYGYVSGFRLRGGRPLLRQITVLQSEAGAPLAEAVSFIGVYSPFRTDHVLQFEGDALVESLYDPFGANSELVIFRAGATRVENLRSDIGGMPAVVAHGSVAPPQVTANLRFERATGRISGSLFNDTGRPIENAQFVLEQNALDLGTLPPGETRVDGTVYALSSKSAFYRQVVGVDGRPDDLALVSRDVAARAMLGLNRNSVVRKDLAGLHLVGWQAGSPLPVDLANRRSDRMSETLLLVGLPLAGN
ncbi:MAG: hypothetical protein ACE5H9_15195 [Anaerolineae bacterium]